MSPGFEKIVVAVARSDLTELLAKEYARAFWEAHDLSGWDLSVYDGYGSEDQEVRLQFTRKKEEA